MSLPFFAGFGFAGGSGLFLLRGAVGCSGFLVRFLVFRFWGFIAHNNFMLRIDWPAAWKFPRRQGHRASDAGSCKVRLAPGPQGSERRVWLVHHVQDLPDVAVPAIAKRLTDVDAEVRELAAEILGLYGPHAESI